VTEPAVIICRDADDLARRAAGTVYFAARDAITSFGCFTHRAVGRLDPPRGVLYSLLASAEYQSLIDWSNVHLSRAMSATGR